VAADHSDMEPPLDQASRSRRLSSDRGDVIIGWFTKIVIILTLVGLAVFDGASVVTARLSAEDGADRAARAASESWQTTHDLPSALAAAQASLQDSNNGTSVVTGSLRLDADGTAHITVRRRANTIVIGRIPPLRSWADVAATAIARSTAS
jgi:Flp pilus assembly protein TadG